MVLWVWQCYSPVPDDGVQASILQALAASIASFGFLYLRRLYTISPDSVYRLAMLQLNTNPAILEVRPLLGFATHLLTWAAVCILQRWLSWIVPPDIPRNSFSTGTGCWEPRNIKRVQKPRRWQGVMDTLQVMGAPVAGSNVRATVLTGGGLRLKGLQPRLRSRRVQMIFPLTGAERRGLVSLEAKKIKVSFRKTTSHKVQDSCPGVTCLNKNISSNFRSF